MNGDTEPLVRTANGSALLCGCCGKVEVTLGNAVLCLERDDFRAVLDLIDSFDPEGAPDTPARSFIIRNASGDGAYAFHRREVLELRELVRRTEQALAPVNGTLSRPRFDTRSLLN